MSSDMARSPLCDPEPLPEDARHELLKLARAALSRAVGAGGDWPQIHHPVLDEPRGVFVTLTKNEALRGCIGNPHATAPLVDQVIHVAESAGLRDPRFPAVTADELDEIDIEISVLSPMRELGDVSEIEIGRHGLFVKRGMWSGLLLPKVAERYGWDAEAFLNHVCQKAGLPMNAWQANDTQVWVFGAEVFAESQKGAD